MILYNPENSIHNIRPLPFIACEVCYISLNTSEAVMRIDCQMLLKSPLSPYWLDPSLLQIILNITKITPWMIFQFTTPV